jgi:translation initiation factor IF-2
MEQGSEQKPFRVLIKGDVHGSITSVSDSLRMIDTNGQVSVEVIGSGVGDITESDILMAGGPNVIIYGFNVNMSAGIKRLALAQGVSVRLFTVIYELLDDAKAEMSKLIAPEVKETEQGKLAIRGVFRLTSDLAIVGGEMLEGRVKKEYIARATRKKEIIGEATVINVQREKRDVPEAVPPEMCGLSLKTNGKKLKLEIGDHLIFLTREIHEVKL